MTVLLAPSTVHKSRETNEYHVTVFVHLIALSCRVDTRIPAIAQAVPGQQRRSLDTDSLSTS